MAGTHTYLKVWIIKAKSLSLFWSWHLLACQLQNLLLFGLRFCFSSCSGSDWNIRYCFIHFHVDDYWGFVSRRSFFRFFDWCGGRDLETSHAEVELLHLCWLVLFLLLFARAWEATRSGMILCSTSNFIVATGLARVQVELLMGCISYSRGHVSKLLWHLEPSPDGICLLLENAGKGGIVDLRYGGWRGQIIMKGREWR